jgi:16S rRNA (cytosine967-C5)-methyltransferase
VTDPPPSAREAALEALRRADAGATFLREELHCLFERRGLDPRDRALALQLAAGTVRHRRTLRLLLSHVRGGHGREASIQPDLRPILELAAFQLVFLDRVPAYAAVNEAVEQARREAGQGPRAEKVAGFVNGVLRGLTRLVAARDLDGHPSPTALPHPDGGVVRLREAVLPDPKESVAAFLGAAYSYPDWLVARWLAEHGDKAEHICRAGNRRPRLFARVAPAVDPASEAAGKVAPGARRAYPTAPAAGSSPVALPPWLAQAFRAPGPPPLDVSDVPLDQLAPLLEQGVLTIQDPSAMVPVAALAPAPGESILDLCASPGTKTTQMVEAMGDRGRIVACDRTEEKLLPLRQTVAARRLASVTVCLADAVAEAAPPGGFDAALVDAPCSNTGVLARRPEARWRLRPGDLRELPRVQGGLLARAAALVRPGGRLVYATCSIQREENEGAVDAFLKGQPAWRLERSDQVLPGPDHDGAFWALLRCGQ